jgi:hypothetical protein
MSVIGPAGLVPNSRKQRLFYYQTDAFGREISCSVAAKFLIEYGLSPLANARHAEVKAFSGSVSERTIVPPPLKPASRPAYLASWPWIKQPVPGQGRITIDQVQMARRRCEQTRTEWRVANLEIYDRIFKIAANMTEWRSPLSTYPAYAHLKPLNWDYVDRHKKLRPKNPSGIVLIEVFGGLLATTEAFLRNGIKIRKLYVCENNPKAREAAKFRLEAFSLIFPELLAPDAWAECVTALPQDIRKISKEDLSRLEPADVIVASFPCQGFSQASSLPLGLRDARSRLLLQAVDIVHMVFELWRPVSYIFENVDSSNHRIPAVRDEFNRVVKGLLGRPCIFDAVAVGSYAHRSRC